MFVLVQVNTVAVITRILLLSIIMLVPSNLSLAQTESETKNSFALSTSYPIQLFMQLCLIDKADESSFEEQSHKFGLEAASKEIAERYVAKNQGKVFVTKNEHGLFAASLLKNGLCSIFIHQGNPSILKTSMESWLPPKGSGFTYSTEIASETETLKSTAYNIYRGSDLIERWVISIPKVPETDLKAIMSYTGPKSLK